MASVWISYSACHVSLPPRLPLSAFQHTTHLMYMNHGEACVCSLRAKRTRRHTFCKTLTLVANGYLWNIFKDWSQRSNAIKLDLHFVKNSKDVLVLYWSKWIWSDALQEEAFKTINCCAWTCHFHSSAFFFFLKHQKDPFCCLIKQQLQTDFYFLTNQLLIALLVPENCLILVWQRSSSLKSCRTHRDLERLVHVFSVLVATRTSNASHFSSQ